MGKPFTQLYFHLVWATWDRLPLITPGVETLLHSCFHADCQDLHLQTLAIGGLEDHIHLLLQAPPTLCVSEIVKQLKGNSSHLVNSRLAPLDGFKWQGYYGAFSVSRGDLRKVTDYILGQRERHAQNRIWDNAERTEFVDWVSQ